MLPLTALARAFVAAAAALDCASVRPFEPDAWRDGVRLDRHCGDAAALDSSAVAVPPLCHRCLRGARYGVAWPTGGYGTQLAPEGALAFHISNRHLRLGPVLGRLAAHHGLTALERVDEGERVAQEPGKRPSNWLVMARDPRSLGLLTTNPKWKAPAVTVSTPLWTDDFTNILYVFRFR